MSELQISLLGIGVTVIVGVYLFNLWQARKFRQKAEERVEPLQGAAGPVGAHAHRAQYAVDPAIDYLVEVSVAEPSDGAELHEELLALTAEWRKPVSVTGRDAGDEWRDAGIGCGTEFPHLRFAVQMANRAGCTDPSELAAFRDAVIRWAARVGGAATYGDIAEAYKMAAELDSFCAEVDIAIGVNVVNRDGESFHGAEIQRLAEAAGLKLEADGVFYYRGNFSSVLFTVDNHEPMSFVPEQMNTLQTGGITLLLDVPRVSDGAQVFDLMLETARNFASALDGVLVDDKRIPLSDAATEKIRAELCAILDKMGTAQIAAGSPRALRLFS
jgi:hypothetical protein